MKYLIAILPWGALQALFGESMPSGVIRWGICLITKYFWRQQIEFPLLAFLGDTFPLLAFLGNRSCKDPELFVLLRPRDRGTLAN